MLGGFFMPVPKSIVQQLIGVGSGGGVDDLLTKAYSNGVRVRWHVLMGRDVTNKPTRVEIIALQGATLWVLKSEQPAAAAQGVTLTGDILLPGLFRVGARIIGASSGDVLEAYVYGELEQVAGTVEG